MNKLFETRNKQICAMFYAHYGTMPTMVLYAHIGAAFDLSEESIRKIIKAGLRAEIGKGLPTTKAEMY